GLRIRGCSAEAARRPELDQRLAVRVAASVVPVAASSMVLRALTGHPDLAGGLDETRREGREGAGREVERVDGLSIGSHRAGVGRPGLTDRGEHLTRAERARDRVDRAAAPRSAAVVDDVERSALAVDPTDIVDTRTRDRRADLLLEVQHREIARVVGRGGTADVAGED